MATQETGTATASPARLQIVKLIKAPRDKVYDAWTRPELLQHWWGAGDDYEASITDTDAQVGGKYRWAMRHKTKGMEHIVGGEFTEMKRPEKLVFTWMWEGPAAQGMTHPSRVTLEFHDEKGATRLVLTHELLPTKELVDKHAHGWEACLGRLTRVLEAGR